LTVELRVLGPLEVVRDESPVAIGGPRQRALLALLLARAGAVVSRDRLVDELWDDAPPPSAVNVLQTYVSHLRKALPPGRLVTRPPGYVLEVEPGELDLHSFERLAEEGTRALADGDAQTAFERLSTALGLWRGPALGNVTESAFARVEAARLEELRLAVLAERLEADLALGRHAQIVGELEALVAEEPLRERLRAQLMLALYRSGRQSEALAVYREARAALVDELGIEPGQALREVHAAILRQDTSLEATAAVTPSRAPSRSLIVACFDERNLDALLGLVEPLVHATAHDLVLLMPVAEPQELTRAARTANDRRTTLAGRGLTVRTAAFTSGEPAPDIIRLLRDSEATLLVADSAARLDTDGGFDPQLTALLAGAPCDVALLAGAGSGASSDERAPVLVPFGGAEHEWSAVELAAWLAQTENRPLRLAGVAAAPLQGRRDASRLLASASLLVQQVTGVETEPVLVAAGAEELSAASREARALILGLPDEWRNRGLGPTRATLVERAACPLLLVRGGLRPGGLAPAVSFTRFTWTVSAGAG
jgi:DNA-binding SARP family transcriptional activator